MAARHGVKVRKAGAAGVRGALRDGGQAMVLFAAGYFAGGSGHFMQFEKFCLMVILSSTIRTVRASRVIVSAPAVGTPQPSSNGAL